MTSIRPDASNLRILIVDDDEDDFVITRDLLSERLHSCTVEWASTFDSGLASLSSGSHDLAIVDYRLGAQTGLDLLERGGQLGWHTPMILLTGTDDPAVDQRATENGAADYLVKQHLDGTVLERAVRYAVARAEILANSRESEVRFRSIVENASDAIVITDEHQKVSLWNPAAVAMFGLKSEDAIGVALAEILSLRPGETSASGTEVTEALAYRFDGRPLALEVSSSTWTAGRGLHTSHIMRDVTERAHLQRQLREQATCDSLTGLPNRASFRRALELAAADAKGYAALFIDLDDFKLVNDRLGHAAGDDVLQQAASRITEQLGDHDMVARLGGDEFAVLVAGIANRQALDGLIESLLAALGSPYEISGQHCSVGASIGAALHDSAKSAVDVLQDADVAMYAAKAQGKGRAAWYAPAQRAALMDRHELARALRDTRIEGGFEVHYQPVVNLADKRIMGVEALLRWRHPKLGLLTGERFIALAEESGLIVPIGLWVVEQAIGQLGVWREDRIVDDDFTMSVNVAARQLMTEEFCVRATEMLERQRIGPHALCLEVTETTLLEDEAVTVLRSLRAEGFRIAIDDFGTGYSALSSLVTCPATIAKIDRSLISPLPDDRRAATLLHGILALTSALGFTVVAEGIETRDQEELLLELGCHLGQGYYLGRPSLPEKIAAIIRGGAHLQRAN